VACAPNAYCDLGTCRSRITEFDVPGAGVIVDVTAGPDGNLWVIDALLNRVGRISTSGAKIDFFPIPTKDARPNRIIAGPDGNIWFTETIGKIGRATLAGAIEEYATPPGAYPWGIATGVDGKLWFTEVSARRVAVMVVDGSIEKEHAIPDGDAGPWEITAGPDGNLWFTDDLDRIWRVTPSGTFSAFAPRTSSSGLIGITAGADGNLWFAESTANQIGRITASGQLLEEIAIPSPNARLRAITRGADGNVWFLEAARGAPSLGRVTPSGTISEFPIPAVPTSICSGPDGNVWFPESDAGRIARFVPP